jgi:diadenosine tetraphosphate (Ap4A) HIT family hydrolase
MTLGLGELVEHVHVYLVPRYAHMPKSGLEVLAGMFADERPWSCTDEEAEEAAGVIRRELRRA